MTSWSLVSHKLLRWLTPFLLAALFLTNALLALQDRFLVLLALQVIFYISSWVGWRCSRNGRRAGVFSYPFAFCLANVGFFLGIVSVIRNRKIVAY